MKISEKLRLIRQISGLTQEKISRQLDVSFATLNSWINEKSLPRKKKQAAINELYSQYAGTKIIPDTLLQAKKKVIALKSQKHPGIVKEILANPDIHKQFVLSLTYNTNRIEGSTLTEAETAGILFENVSPPNRSLTEQLEAKNHQYALKYLFAWVLDKNSINEGLILKLHAILMNSIRDDAGAYRNHGVRILGANIPTANYLKVPVLLKELIKNINASGQDIIARVSEIHGRFEQIHPFSDGNGRIGRLLMQVMLLLKNIPPALILQEKKPFYIKYLNKFQMTGDSSLLQDFISDAVMSGFDVLERKNKRE
jgi:Fic family protein/DNA-binding XRE family transcriptional regulator